MEGIEYDETEPALFAWRIEFDGGEVQGLVGAMPLTELVPHESTKPNGGRRPRYPVQIRPVMALMDEELPSTTPIGEPVEFHGDHRHEVTPVQADGFEVVRPVIADGHHRVAAALRSGGDPLIMAMLVSARDSGLDAGAFHRVYPESVALPEEIPGCAVEREPPNESLVAGRIAIVTRQGSVGVSVVDEGADTLLRRLPAGLSARYVAGPLGLDEADATYEDDIRVALQKVDAGSTAILLPTSDVRAVVGAARSGMTLPPKATRFRPKPIRGLMLRRVPA